MVPSTTSGDEGMDDLIEVWVEPKPTEEQQVEPRKRNSMSEDERMVALVDMWLEAKANGGKVPRTFVAKVAKRLSFGRTTIRDLWHKDGNQKYKTEIQKLETQWKNTQPHIKDLKTFIRNTKQTSIFASRESKNAQAKSEVQKEEARANTAAATTTTTAASHLFVQLHYEGRDKPERGISRIPLVGAPCHDLFGLVDYFKEKRHRSLQHCEVEELLVYSPGTTSFSEDTAMEFDCDLPTCTTCKNPLIVVAPAPPQQKPDAPANTGVPPATSNVTAAPEEVSELGGVIDPSIQQPSEDNNLPVEEEAEIGAHQSSADATAAPAQMASALDKAIGETHQEASSNEKLPAKPVLVSPKKVSCCQQQPSDNNNLPSKTVTPSATASVPAAAALQPMLILDSAIGQPGGQQPSVDNNPQGGTGAVTTTLNAPAVVQQVPPALNDTIKESHNPPVNTVAAPAAMPTTSVWVQLYYKGQDKPCSHPTKIRPIPEDIDDLARQVKEENHPMLKHCTVGTMYVYHPGTTSFLEASSIDPGDAVPAGTTSKNPLIVVATALPPQKQPIANATAVTAQKAPECDKAVGGSHQQAPNKKKTLPKSASAQKKFTARRRKTLKSVKYNSTKRAMSRSTNSQSSAKKQKVNIEADYHMIAADYQHGYHPMGAPTRKTPKKSDGADVERADRPDRYEVQIPENAPTFFDASSSGDSTITDGGKIQALVEETGKVMKARDGSFDDWKNSSVFKI